MGEAVRRADAFVGKVAAVTGAGSGIGCALAAELARRGARLALSDKDPAGLATTAGLARALGADVHTATVDVSDREAVRGWAAEVAAHHGVVHQLYNNAGVVAGARPVTEVDYADLEEVLAVNLWGVVHGTREFIDHLVASGDGHLVNISSLNGFFAQPGMAGYVTSKFAVRGFSEVVRADMVRQRLPVRVTVVHPGGVRTNIATAALEEGRRRGVVTAADERRTRAYNEVLLRMSPEDAATTILDAVARRRGRVLVGADAKVLDLVVRALPSLYLRVSDRIERRITGDHASRPAAAGRSRLGRRGPRASG